MIFSLAQLALLALGLAAALILFLNLKREMRAQVRRDGTRIERVLERLKEMEHPEPAPGVPQSGLNLNKRVQAMRLYRRGENVSHIAAALGVPRREVELMIRVNQISSQRALQA